MPDEMHSNNETRIALIEREVADMKHELFGNGQPGKLDRIEKDIRMFRNQMDSKFDRLGDRVTRVMVAVVLLSGTAGAGAFKVVQIIVGG